MTNSVTPRDLAEGLAKDPDMQADLERLRELDRKRRPLCPQLDNGSANRAFHSAAPAMMSLLERVWARIGELEKKREWRLIESAPCNAETFYVCSANSGSVFVGFVWLSPKDGSVRQTYAYKDGNWKQVNDITHYSPKPDLPKPPEQKP